MLTMLSASPGDLFLQQDDPSQQLVLQATLGDSEVHHRRPGTDLRTVRWVGQLGGDVEGEALHHIHLFISNLHLQDEVTMMSPYIKLQSRQIDRRPTLKVDPDLM